jgi:hypothetical protein
MHYLFISSSSVVRINAQEGTIFFHRRGLQHGDPLSPMLFILVVETLQTLISNIQQDLIQTHQSQTENVTICR